MKQLLHVLLLITSIHSASIAGMECTISTHYAPQLPKEIIARIAGCCWPREKNTLMRLCKNFYVLLKDRELILRANPCTVSLIDKQEDVFRYTYANKINMMQFLLNNGAIADYKNMLGITLFHVASDNGNIEAMKLLVDYGADVNVLKPEIHPFHEAVYKGDKETVKALLQLKIDPNLALQNGSTPLYFASAKGHADIVESLLYAGAHVDQANGNGVTPLYSASHKGHIDIVRLLIHAQANVNLANKKGVTPLYIASEYGHADIVESLLYAGAHVDQANGNGVTPLYIASHNGHTDIVEFLIQAQANVNQTDRQRFTPLLVASYQGHIEIVQLLINGGANVNYKTFTGWTPLSAASYHGNIEIIKLLLFNGANIHASLRVDSTIDSAIKKEDTALTIAQKKGHTEIVELLGEQLQQNTIARRSKKKKGFFFSFF